MKQIVNPSKESWPALCQRPQLELEFLDGAVKNILNRVKKSGDAALLEFALQFDKVKLTDFKVTESEIKSAVAQLDAPLKAAIQTAASNIEKFHAAQKREVIKIETMPGVACWRKSVAIQKVGIYIPGGSAPLFSTVLMLGIPAKLAGCTEVILCTPPASDGSVNPAILFAADLVGIKKIFKVGGAQAIAALAYGTKSIPSVDKIFGPGNQYVTKAKQIVSQEGVAIDMPAGPSEVLIIADDTADASFVAADLLSQAEHGADSQVVLVSLSEAVVTKAKTEVDRQVELLPRKDTAKEALKSSLSVVFNDESKLIDFVNEYAPEHLIINTQNSDAIADQVMNAGSVFLGGYTPESAGDYASGTNHTLPTNGFARAFSGVSLESFMKHITFQKISEQGLKVLGPVVEKMAEAEQLIGHKNSISIRLKKLNSKS
ncbi:MAG: histidinol dehydrogenase [Azospira oryzae]|jgi:histidinol dehydrogenase|nr:MAG: histidinol dehydrogenase [Azospira oryzae]